MARRIAAAITPIFGMTSGAAVSGRHPAEVAEAHFALQSSMGHLPFDAMRTRTCWRNRRRRARAGERQGRLVHLHGPDMMKNAPLVTLRQHADISPHSKFITTNR